MLVFYKHFAVGIGELIRQAAVLSAFTAVGTASGHGLADVALTAVTHAQGAVHEAFELHVRMFMDFTYLVQREFTSQHNARKSHILQKFHFFHSPVVGLRAGMKFYGRQIELQNAHILNNQRIGANFIQLSYKLLSFGKLFVGQNSIQRHQHF